LGAASGGLSVIGGVVICERCLKRRAEESINVED